ncbi:hypothetical protein BCV70DRAFT_89869 [Testicularia cyperi]|uniref:Uncharacterized protein n=1 Tax=Testicularia cyperi TaxID=1882483 RepID=A0A317XUR5_9BASI|nr:hypothetical protein BCV70DRAFT_89869 [Testicularia cyperi]
MYKHELCYLGLSPSASALIVVLWAARVRNGTLVGSCVGGRVVEIAVARPIELVGSRCVVSARLPFRHGPLVQSAAILRTVCVGHERVPQSLDEQGPVPAFVFIPPDVLRSSMFFRACVSKI